MLGVTLFGIFFTPVFYLVIRRFSGRNAAASKVGSVLATSTENGSILASKAVIADGHHESPT